MRVCLLILLAIVALSTLACGVILEEPTTRSRAERTPDVEATIEAAVEATREVEISIEATIAARVGATRSAQPEATLILAPGPTTVLPPSPTRRAVPVPFPTATPLPFLPTPTPLPFLPTPTPLPFLPTPTPLPFLPTPTPLPTLTPLEILSLSEYADRHAGGPGAIYIGDLGLLAGPAPNHELGDNDGTVPTYAILQHSWIYESDYYKSLLRKAKLSNPTRLTSRGQQITLQHACINRALLPCILIESYLAPNVEDRTNGQLRLVVSSFPALGLAGPDTLQLISDETLDMANVYNGYIAGTLPVSEVTTLWGIYPDHETTFESVTKTLPRIDAILAEETNGGVTINHNWFAGNDQFLFSRKSLRELTDFQDLKTRSHSAALSDWINGMGAQAQFLSFAEVYTALERGVLDAGITGAAPGYGQRWYEVVDYVNGPLTGWSSTSNVINAERWDRIPEDLQQILIEEGAKAELEQLRLASIQNVKGLQSNIEVGLIWIEFSPEIRTHGFNVAVVEHVIPGWLRRARDDSEAIEMFNWGVGPYVGLYIDENGSPVKTGITEGPHAGKTMEQVLSE